MTTEKKHIKRLLAGLLVFSLPFICFIAMYIILDPFKVIRTYDDYNKNTIVDADRDVVSTETFIKNYPRYNYKSFIFGNSRSKAFLTKSWSKYINDSVPFHFDASGESLYGIWIKLKYLDRIGDSLKNVLIISDAYLYKNVADEPSGVFMKDYKLSGVSAINFQLAFFKTFLNNYFFIRYLDLKLFHTYRPYMKDFLPKPETKGYFAPVTNDLFEMYAIREIQKDSSGYYKNRDSIFFKRKDTATIDTAVLAEKQMQMLSDIKQLFIKHKTNLKIVISPLYTQEYFNPEDLKKLQDIFGKENVFDFSGKNSITNYAGNYYEKSHYKILVGNKILKTIYDGKNNVSPGL